MHRGLALIQASVVLFAGIGGCATSPVSTRMDYVAFDQVSANPTAFDEKAIDIKGYIQADLIESTSLEQSNRGQTTVF